MRTKTIATLATLAFAALVLAGPASALAAPVLGIDSTHFPPSVPAGTYARYELTVSNNGTSPTTEPVSVDFAVPSGFEVTEVTDEVQSVFGFPIWGCAIAGDSRSVSCTGPEFFGIPGFPEIPPGEEACVGFFEEIGEGSLTCHILITLKAEANATPETIEPTIEACGGGAASCANASDPIDVSGPAQFGLRSFDGRVLKEDGDPATQAGSHPYVAETEFFLDSLLTAQGSRYPEFSNGELQNTLVKLPPGLLGNPLAIGTCTQEQLIFESCPPESQVGVVTIFIGGAENGTPGHPAPEPIAVYKMETPSGTAATPIGTPALFAFNAAGNSIQVYAKLRTGSDYGVTVINKNAPQTLPLIGVHFSFWGVPADPSHDEERGNCLGSVAADSCPSADSAHPKPFLFLPTSCVGPVETELTVTSWQEAEDSRSFLSHDNTLPTPNPIGTDGCNAVDFSPSLEARPTTNVADSPSGLDVDLHVPQHEECEAGPPVSCEAAEADLKDTTVTLPEGMVINPSGANGLGACTEAQFGFTSKEGDVIHTTPDPATCPDAAKLGTVEVDSPLVDHPLKGNAYIAQPYQNPFNSLLALYITVDDPQTGVVVKLAGEVHADPNTGQLTTTVLHNPQLPFEDFKLHFFGGAGGSLRTPATCGTYTTTSSLTPWSAPDSGPPATPSDPWAISQAPGGGSCPTSAGALPNSLSFDAGTVSPIAGTYTPFVDNTRREDGSQEISTVTVSPPPGLAGKLAGIPYCPEAALREARAKSGRAEEASPSCPAASRIGTVYVSAGAGPAPYNTQGTAYLTGPYKGAPLSVAIVTPATAGPFDLGTIVVLTALYIDQNSGQITAISDPIPQILQGIPLDLRSLQVHLDRSQFVHSGTSCDPLKTTGTVLSTLGQTTPLSSRFQLGECSALAFKPKLGIRLTGGTKRGAHPALRGTVTMPEGGANIAKASVALPHSEFLDQGHIGTVCTRVQFSEGDSNGSSCPAASIYGHAVGTSPLVDYPLEGNAYLRSSSNKLPDLVIALHGPPSQPVAVDVVGRIDSVKGGIRTTFEGVPDLPVSSFVLNMEGGKKGLLQNSTDICQGTHKATAEFDGQNGKGADLTPVLKNGKCRKAKRKHARHSVG